MDAKEWEIIALAAVKYYPAIPQLIQALHAEHLRTYVALALGELKAKEAVQKILDVETDPCVLKMLRKALNEIDA